VKFFFNFFLSEFIEKFKIEFVCHGGSTLLRLFSEFVSETFPKMEIYSNFYVNLSKIFDRNSKELIQFLSEEKNQEQLPELKNESLKMFKEFEQFSQENPPKIDLFQDIIKITLEILEKECLKTFLASEPFRHYVDEFCGATFIDGNYIVEKDDKETDGERRSKQ
jgi:hypothetical protein